MSTFLSLDKELSTSYTAWYSSFFHTNMTDLTALWQNVLSEIEPTVSTGNFITLFKATTLISLEDEIATIGVPSTMIMSILQKKSYDTTIKTILDKITGQDNSVVFVSQGIMASDTTQQAGPLFGNTVLATPKPQTLSIGHLPGVRPEFTFGNFAVSGSNQLAFVSATNVSQNIGSSYNPFFIYGPVGVGKTHLMHAIANEVYQKQPDKKVLYITSEQFTNEVVDAIRNNETAKMKKRFRSAYLLLIDDIQFIEGKKAVQEEIFHTFNALIDQGSQICLSSDRPPHEIKNIMDRLASRFAGGLTVDIEPPDFELKTAILLIKAKKYGHDLSIEVAKQIALNAQDTRSLEGLLLRVITQATTQGSEITEAIAQQVLKGREEDPRPSNFHSDGIIKAVCGFYGIKPTQLKGPKRDASLVKARQVAMYLLKEKLGLTLVEVGNILGGRDHTTVMHGVEKIEKMLDGSHSVTEDILGITKALSG